MASPENVLLSIVYAGTFKSLVLRKQVKHADGDCSFRQAEAATTTFLYPDDTNHLTVREATRMKTKSESD